MWRKWDTVCLMKGSVGLLKNPWHMKRVNLSCMHWAWNRKCRAQSHPLRSSYLSSEGNWAFCVAGAVRQPTRFITNGGWEVVKRILYPFDFRAETAAETLSPPITKWNLSGSHIHMDSITARLMEINSKASQH